jgi:putative ABC transport system substrate-binding protein
MAVAGVDVIVAYGTPATLAVLKETSGIAVVFAAVPDPQALGITGKHLSGIASKVPIAGIIKDFKLIKNFGSLGIIYNNSERDTVLQAEEAVRLGTQFGYRPVKFNVTGCGDAERIKGVDALFLTSSCVAQQCLAKVG